LCLNPRINEFSVTYKVTDDKTVLSATRSIHFFRHRELGVLAATVVSNVTGLCARLVTNWGLRVFPNAEHLDPEGVAARAREDYARLELGWWRSLSA